MALIVLICAVFGAGVFFVVTSLIQIRENPKLSLREMEEKRLSLQKKKQEIKIPKSLARIAAPFLKFKYLQNLKNQAEILKIELNLEGLVLFKLLIAVIVGAATMLLIGLAYAPLGLVGGFFLLDMYYLNKISKKKVEIASVLPETVDLMEMSITAGSDFLSALRWVVEKSDYNSFVEQLAIVLNEIRIGKPRAEALKNMSKRLQIPDVNSFTRAIIQSERMGTSIEEAFRNLSEDTRNMRYQNGERYAIKASLKILFPLIFFILPAILIIVAGPILIKFQQGGIPTSGF